MQRYGPDAPQIPRLAASLRHLAHDVDSAWPSRPHSSDGWIGDPAHQQRESDHNPDARGIVHALDLTALKIKPWLIVIAAVQHPSTSYVIFDRIIYSRSHGMQPRYYEGPDPHTSHVHISILHTRPAETSSRPWLLWH